MGAMDQPFYQITAKDGAARAGRLLLNHGRVETPAFMPVGTYGAVKTLSPDELMDLGFEMILSNTYHLWIRPGTDLLDQLGGLHRFMGWGRPILTDSGGFQVFSLSGFRKITEEGVHFQSHLNGDKLFLSPEICAQIQQSIGSDIAMVLDECVALPNEEATLKAAVERSLRWAERFLKIPRKEGQRIFGIAQGGLSPDLRRESIRRTAELPIDGLAIGGLSVGESPKDRQTLMEAIAPDLPTSLPRYLMGIGTPADLLDSVALGIDLFDCVLPTRNARNGGFFTDQGLLNIRNSKFASDPNPVVENCTCPCCKGFSRAYLRHLFMLKEILGCRLATLHNLHYYRQLMQQMRRAIQEGRFQKFHQEFGEPLRRAYWNLHEEI